MATDTARVQLELASGRSENTAPFYQTAQRRRNKQFEPDAASVDAPDAPSTKVDVPLATVPPVNDREVSREHRGRTPWLAFAIAVLSVGFAVWWVMAQRIPDIDPRDVIARNLNDALTAMADGRYTDPSERSAFHYFSTVLALDPANADAVTGIDAIADRHLTNARVLLSEGKIAEAGVALEKARRVRPDHDGLAVFDAQWRAELRQLIAAATTLGEPNTVAIDKLPVTKVREAPVLTARSTSSMPVAAESAPLPAVADVTTVAAVLAASQPSTSPQTMEPPAPDTGADVVEETGTVPELQPALVADPPAVELKLIKMVKPQYPQEAVMRGIEGWVDVSLQVTASGDVIEPRIEASNRGRLFNRAALAAVEQWKYEPPGDAATSDRLVVHLRFQRSH